MHDLQAVLADGHGPDALFAAGLDRLGAVQKPDFQIEMIQLGGGHRREAEVLPGSPDGRILEGHCQRDGLANHPATGAQPAAALERDKRSRYKVVGSSGQSRVGKRRLAAENGRPDQFVRGGENELLLPVAEIGTRRAGYLRASRGGLCTCHGKNTSSRMKDEG